MSTICPNLRKLSLDLKRIGSDNIIWIMLPNIQNLTSLSLKYSPINLNSLDALFKLKFLNHLAIEEAICVKNDEYDEIELTENISLTSFSLKLMNN